MAEMMVEKMAVWLAGLKADMKVVKLVDKMAVL